MLDARHSNELDLAYMPYHEGLVNHNAPPVRGSLSVRVPAQSSSFYNDSDDDDVSDDPAWMNAPRGSLQPAFPPSLLKKTSSSLSVTDTQSSSPVSPGTAPSSEDEQQRQKDKDDEEDDDYFPPMPKLPSPPPRTEPRASTRRVSMDSEDKAESPQEQTLRKCKSMPHKPRNNKATATSPVGSSQYSSRPVTPSTDAGRDSMMRYRPSDLKPQELTAALLSRDSLAPETFDSSRSIDPFASSRSDMLASGRGSVMHFGPRVTEEGLSDYLCAVKTGNLQVLRACLQDRNTDFTERDPVHGQSAMHIAVRFGQLHAVQLLCGKKTRGLLIDAVDNRQNTPLHLAAAKSRRITKYLLEHGADAVRVNNRNQTPLAVHIITTKSDDPLIAEMLLQHKTDPNSPLGNSTLLHKAVDLKLFEIASRLVRHGARLDVKDAQGRMVFEKVDRKVLRQLCGKIAFPPVWVPNTDRTSCMVCLRNFSRLGVGVRRHHCRHCGRLVCGRCSHVSVESEAFPTSFEGHIDRNAADARSNLKRVCKTCSSVFDERAKQAKESSPGSNRKWSDAFMARVVGCAWDEINRKDGTPKSSRRGSLAH